MTGRPGRLAAETFAGVFAAVGLASGIVTVFGIRGGGPISLVVVGASVGGVLVGLVLRRTLRSRPKSIPLGSLAGALDQHLSASTDVRCVFSAGDQLRHALSTRIEETERLELRRDLSIRLVVRERTKADSHRVTDNLTRLASTLERVQIKFSAQVRSWDLFMIEGVLFDQRFAAVGFYYRAANVTHTVSDQLLLVDKGRSEVDAYLYRALERAFSTLWDG